MKVGNFNLFLLSLILPILIIFGQEFWLSSSSKINLIISAAASLQPMMEEIKIVYEQNHPDISLNYNFGASGLLAQQIERGAPVNIFFSASTLEMDKLKQKNLIRNDIRRNILKNKIVLISHKNFSKLKNISNLTDDNISKIIIGTPDIVPVGRYAQQVFNYYQIWDKIQSKLVFAKDEQAVLSYVELGYAEAAIMQCPKCNKLIAETVANNMRKSKKDCSGWLIRRIRG